MPFSQHRRLLIASALALLLTACATYHAEPLPDDPDLASDARLDISTYKLSVPGLKTHPFEATDGLDRTEVVTLAVINNPQLNATRLKAGVAAAQLIQAGIIPNPQISANFVHPLGGPPPLVNGYSLGLMQDLTKLVARGAARASAKSNANKINLNILWQEWQVAQQARQLFVQARSQVELHKVLQDQRDLSRDNYRRDKRALQQGFITLPTVSADLVALVDADTQLRQLEIARNKTWHTLADLLGLQPTVEPTLVDSNALDAFTPAEFKAAIAHLPARRPDLLALQAGYQSQQESVRQAILQQFPQLSIGPTQGSDTGKVRTVGFGINVSLPLFDRNQGNIAIQRATRAMLRQQYQVRLDQAVNQANQIWQETRIQQRQLRQLESRLPELKKTTTAAQRAFAQGNLSAGTYINLRSSLLSKQVETIRLKASLEQSQATLETLLGMTVDTRRSGPAADGDLS